MTSHVAEMARQAAAEVRTRGLAKFTSLDDDGRMCSAGLVRFVASGSARGSLDADGRELFGAVELATGDGYLSHWNDAPERTAEDVALMFERVAEQFESAGVA